MMNGVSQATFWILPMLDRHPDEYPRFRDCFLADEEHPEYDNHIFVYTRTGGGNRESYEDENDDMTMMETYVTDYDDDFDCTYATWVFRVPEKWKKDYDAITDPEVGLRGISEEYKAQLKKIYPKLADKFDKIVKD
jgi:hypothetical protein